jgi:type II secretory pathway predicted ATPase ExeA
MVSPPTLTPFPAGPDVSAYVPSAEVEQSLAYLIAKLEDAPGWVGVCGPSGVGKTLLARLLLRRLASRTTPVYVPSCALPPSDLERWIADAAHAQPGESVAPLAARLNRAARPLLVALDEAQLAGPELLPWLEALCSPESSGRAVLVWTEPSRAALPPLLARCPARVFVEPLPLARVPHYVAVQLARANAAPELRAALAGRTLERIALASGGNQRQIQRLADAELAAHAWRARAQGAEPLRVGEDSPRRRSASHRLGEPERRPPAPMRGWLAAVATGIALALAALALR